MIRSPSVELPPLVKLYKRKKYTGFPAAVEPVENAHRIAANIRLQNASLVWPSGHVSAAIVEYSGIKRAEECGRVFGGARDTEMLEKPCVSEMVRKLSQRFAVFYGSLKECLDQNSLELQSPTGIDPRRSTLGVFRRRGVLPQLGCGKGFSASLGISIYSVPLGRHLYMRRRQ